MKAKISTYILTLIVLTGFFACEDLDETPLGFETAETAFQSLENFESLNVGTLRTLGSINWFGLLSGSKAVEGGPLFDTYSFAPSESVFSSYWTSSYLAINNVNNVIDNIDQAESGTEQERNNALGQAHFLRAFAYFNLVRLFGEVPLITVGVTESNNLPSDVARTPISEVYSQIVADMQQAESLLPDSNPEWLPTSWAAKAYLSKIYLTMATSPMNIASNYQLAADKAKEIMDNGPFSLTSEFDEIHMEGNPEVIFEFVNSTDAGSDFANEIFQSTSFRGIGNPGNRVFRRFLDEYPEGPRKEALFYLNAEDTSVTSFLESVDGNGEFLNPAWRAANNNDQPDEQKYFVKDSREFSYTKKYTYGSQGQTGNQSDQNVILFRYAEVLLIFAEASNMATGSAGPEEFDAINQVRLRGIGPGSELTGLGQDEFDMAVIEERYLEFAFELKRWYDVLRKEIPLTFDIYDGSGNFTENQAAFPDRFLFPIPQSERDLNPELTQNEGY